MNEEETTTVETEVTEQEAVPEVDPAAELKAREEAIAKRERELQRGFDEVARREREAARPAPVEDDDIPEIPEETAKALEKFFADKYGDKLRAVDNLYADVLDTELSKRENPDAVRDIIAEFGLVPKDDSVRAIREVFDKAEAIARTRDLDPEALKAEAKAEAEKEILSRLAAEGVNVDTIEPKRSDAAPDATLDDDDLPSTVKVRLLKEKYPHLTL